MYSISIDIAGKIIEAKGKTTKEAVENFTSKLPKPFKVQPKATITFSDGKNSKEQFLGPVQIRRLTMPLSKFMLSKQFFFGMK